MFETGKFSIIANNLFLDFVNTAKLRGGQPFETLENFADFFAWTIAAELLDKELAEKFFKQWRDEEARREFLEEALKFRDILRLMAEDIAAGRGISEKAIAAINEQLGKQSGVSEIVKTPEGFEKQFRFAVDEPSKLLKPIAESAADFLCFADLARLRKCESDVCVLYFYDTTKNHRRRWCSMSGCGNKAKAAAFYQRKKQAAS